MNDTAPSFKSDWTDDFSERPALDESRADEYIGKTILVGVTYEDARGKVLNQHQWVGKIKTFSNDDGIQIDLFDSDEFCALPPDPRAIRPAKRGSYRLRSTGQVIEDPDYLATWIRREPEKDDKGTQQER